MAQEHLHILGSNPETNRIIGVVQSRCNARYNNRPAIVLPFSNSNVWLFNERYFVRGVQQAIGKLEPEACSDPESPSAHRRIYRALEGMGSLLVVHHQFAHSMVLICDSRERYFGPVYDATKKYAETVDPMISDHIRLVMPQSLLVEQSV